MGQEKVPSSYEKQLVVLGRTLQNLREEENIEVLTETTLQYLEKEFDYQLLWIAIYDRAQHKLIGQGGRAPNSQISELKKQFTVTPGEILEQVIIQQKPVAIPDLRQEKRIGEWQKIAQKYSLQGTLVFPMRYKNWCFGVVLLASTLWGVSPRAEQKARLSIVLGGLAEALYQIETERQRQQQKAADQSLLGLLSQMRHTLTLEQSLESVVEATHKLLKPTRTNVYWYYPEKRYFWRKVSHPRKVAPTGENPSTSGIQLSDLGSFYQALLSDQLVCIGEVVSSLKADVTARLMQQIQARSLLAAPILFQNELLGFLAVEGKDPRIWQEQEKIYLQGAAQLAALVAPLTNMEATIEEVRLDQALTAGLTQAISSDAQWEVTLKTFGEQLLNRLKVERFVVLRYLQETNQFEISYQAQTGNRRPLVSPFGSLNQVDSQMLQNSSEPIAIENWGEDLKLRAWQGTLMEAGVRSLLLCQTSNVLEGLLMVTCDNPRSWSHRDIEVFAIVSQQVGFMVHQWQLQVTTDQNQKLFSRLVSALGTLQQSSANLQQLELHCLQQLVDIFGVPLAALVSWLPGEAEGRISASIVANSEFALDESAVVPVYTDALVQWALLQKTDLPLWVAADDLPLDTRAWLYGTAISQILVVALRTTPPTATGEEHQPTGIILIADGSDRLWLPERLPVMTVLAKQLAWSRRSLVLTAKLVEAKEDLECLNWYKNRHFEDFYRLIYSGLDKLGKVSDNQANFGKLELLRLQDLLRQLNTSVQGMRERIKREQWEMNTSVATVSVASLLRRSLERLDVFLKQRQLWTQVHSDNNFKINGDVIKIEWIVYEVLLAACRRSPQNGRIDIWCRFYNVNLMDLAVTDHGTLPPAMFSDLEAGRPMDLLMPSPLDEPPGLHLAVCRRILYQLGGEFHFFQLEDGRMITQLLLPIVPTQVPES